MIPPTPSAGHAPCLPLPLWAPSPTSTAWHPSCLLPHAPALRLTLSRAREQGSRRPLPSAQGQRALLLHWRLCLLQRALPLGALCMGLRALPLPWCPVCVPGSAVQELRAPRVVTANTHGTGCSLSAAVAARLALGESLQAAVLVGPLPAFCPCSCCAGLLGEARLLEATTGPCSLAGTGASTCSLPRLASAGGVKGSLLCCLLSVARPCAPGCQGVPVSNSEGQC